MKKILTKVAGMLVVPAVVLSMGLAAPAQAQVNTGLDATGQGGTNVTISPTNIVTTVVNWLLFFVGALSVVMLIWGGIRYATSAGDSSKVTAAKNTIMYALIGLVVAVLAYTIVYFVTTTLLTNQGLQGPGNIN